MSLSNQAPKNNKKAKSSRNIKKQVKNAYLTEQAKSEPIGTKTNVILNDNIKGKKKNTLQTKPGIQEKKSVLKQKTKEEISQKKQNNNLIEEEIVIELKNVSKTFYVFDQQASFAKRLASVFLPSKYSKKVAALKNINFSVKKGEFFGVIGRNGSGKSTLLKIIMGAMDPNDGSEISAKGKMIRLALGMGFDPNLTARDNIYLNGTILGMTFKEISSRFDEIISFAELENFIDTPIRFFSSGMRSRLAFSVAVFATSDIYLIDEFFGGVGDISFKDKSKKVFSERLISGKTIVFVSHSMELIKQNCDRVMIIKDGEGHVFDDVMEGIKYYKQTFKKQRNN